MAVHHGLAAPRGHQAERLRPGAHHQIAANDRICLAHGDADRADILGSLGQAQVNVHGTALLREPRHLDHARALAVELRGLRQNRAHGHHARAADAGDHDVMGAVDRGQVGRGQMAHIDAGRGFLADLAALDGHEAGTEALEAGEILVAARLVDGALAAKLGFHRHDGHAVRLHPAIAAAFADIGIDEDPAIGIREGAALAAAAFFGGAGLHVDDGGHALDVLEPLLHFHQIVAFMAFDIARKG